MEHDDRDPRDWPDDDSQTSPATPSDPGSATQNDEAVMRSDPDLARPEEEAAPAEIESWPSQDATRQSGAAPDPGVSEVAAQPAAPWPTEPPLADSGVEDGWSTRAPEAGATAAQVPPPSEVEAYPAGAAAEPITADPASGPTAAHAVPAAEAATGESTLCPRCGTENRPGLAFCRECGQRLVAAGVATTIERPGTPEGTQACPRCGTHNRAGVAFCQNCGANLRGTAPGYVPPSVAEEAGGPAAVVSERRGAVLGPVVLLIGLVGLVTGYLLPFLYGSGSLFDRAFGSGGYGVGFWDGYPEVGAALADQAYFGLAAPVLLLGLLLVALAVAGFMRAAPGPLQTIGLVVALLWSVGLVILFLVVEVASNWDGDLVGLLRALTPAGIIFFLSGLIILIGVLTRFGRS